VSAKHAKRLRREVRRALNDAVPRRVVGNKPWWIPLTLWVRLYHWLMFGQFARVPRT
jgi:hypothetical protein